jgi:hypothetical protein
MKVWKIGSRWSYDGNKNSSVLFLFRKYNAIFIHDILPSKRKTGILKKVNVNDLIAITDGESVVAIGKVLRTPISITEKWDFGNEMNSYRNPDNIIVKISYHDLSENQRFSYKKRSRFHELHNKVKKEIVRLWNDRVVNQGFSITAKTSTLVKSNDEGICGIIGQSIIYKIPIYQRPYSWSEEQIGRFISDMFISYWGSDKIICKEPMFIGTIQLSDKTFDDFQLVIDGQQRLTTFLVLFKVLNILFPENVDLQMI